MSALSSDPYAFETLPHDHTFLFCAGTGLNEVEEIDLGCWPQHDMAALAVDMVLLQKHGAHEEPRPNRFLRNLHDKLMLPTEIYTRMENGNLLRTIRSNLDPDLGVLCRSLKKDLVERIYGAYFKQATALRLRFPQQTAAAAAAAPPHPTNQQQPSAVPPQQPFPQVAQVPQSQTISRQQDASLTMAHGAHAGVIDLTESPDKVVDGGRAAVAARAPPLPPPPPPEAAGATPRKHARGGLWMSVEVETLARGVEEFGISNWTRIHQKYAGNGISETRTPDDYRSKWNKLVKAVQKESTKATLTDELKASILRITGMNSPHLPPAMTAHPGYTTAAPQHLHPAPIPHEARAAKRHQPMQAAQPMPIPAPANVGYAVAGPSGSAPQSQAPKVWLVSSQGRFPKGSPTFPMLVEQSALQQACFDLAPGPVMGVLDAAEFGPLVIQHERNAEKRWACTFGVKDLQTGWRCIQGLGEFIKGFQLREGDVVVFSRGDGRSFVKANVWRKGMPQTVKFLNALNAEG